MFQTITKHDVSKILTGVKSYLSNSEIDTLIGLAPHTTTRASLFGFHPQAPDHIRDLATDIELIKEKRDQAVERLERLPKKQATTLRSYRLSKTLDETTAELVADAITTGASLASIAHALDMASNRLHIIVKEATHPNASPDKKRIAQALKQRNETKEKARQLLSNE